MLDLEKAQAIFDYLYYNVDGYGISLKERKQRRAKEKDFIYGEIAFDSFRKILTDAQLKNAHQFFIDVGSGTGKAAMAAALLGDFQAVEGIEIFPGLHQAALNVLDKFNALKIPDWRAPAIKFHCSDIFDMDISQADVVFLHCTCFSPKVMDRLCEDHLLGLKKGAIVIASGVSLGLPYQTYGKGKYKMGWGKTSVYFNVKVR